MAAAERRAASWAKLSARIGHLRGLSFLAFLVCGGIFVADGTLSFLAVSLVALVAFFLLIRRHDAVLQEEENQARHALLNAHALARVNGSWQLLPHGRHLPDTQGHAYAADLDLFGPGSLYQRISVAHTRYGKAQLTSWLLEPMPPSEIERRQVAVQELAGMLDFRQGFEAEGMALGQKKSQSGQLELSDGPDPAPLLRWVQTGVSLPGGLALLALSFVIPVSTIAGMVATFHFGLHPISWLAPFLSGLVLLRVARHATGETFAAVSTTEGAFLRYGGMLSCLERLEATSPWIRTRKAELLGTGQESSQRPSAVMARFRALVGWYDLRHNGMVYPFINALLLWDLHCTRALQGWRTGAAAGIERWFEIIGECEALSSLAGLLHDDPSANLPTLTGKGEPAQLRATSLGHPLIAYGRRVENPLPPFEPGQALLITGSNMSGKSTFLRCLGINVVLALAGGPVIAKSFVLPWCKLSTSIRVADSLASGVSHFYAEISKLKATLDQAVGETPLLFLLDEILHGTNSRERQIGARWVLAELLERGACGIVTTHDMELCRLTPPLMERVQQFHFREDVRDEPAGNPADAPAKMTFDYTLRPGPVASGNALRLMRSAGLPVPLAAEGQPFDA
jgi:ABC-type multidrug transport system fused ATPase/permease subunit